MSEATVVIALAVLGLLAVPVADRLRTPSPVVATLFGITVALLPGVQPFTASPDLILPALLPPLLWAAAQSSSWRQFARGWQPIIALAVALVFVTTAVVAAVGSRMHPALTVGAAVVLGAIVAPPDPAAVSAVATRLGLPRRTKTLLEGEGLFNDVTALTIYQVVVAGVLTGTLSVWSAVGTFFYSAIAGIGIGLVTGAIFSWLLDRLPGAELRAGLSLIIPYSAYLSADEAGASGVLAVLTACFLLGVVRRDPDDVDGRIYGRTFWEVVELLVTGFTFGLVGFEFVEVVDELGGSAWDYTAYALVVCLTLIVVRFAWLFPVSGLIRRLRRRADSETPSDWRETLVVAWAGMRAVVTVATALALPTEFPGRSQIVFVAVVVALVTLLLPGLTLPWLVRRLGLSTGQERVRLAEHAIVEAASTAALARLGELHAAGVVTDEELRRLTVWQRVALADPEDDLDEVWTERRDRGRQIRVELLAAARAEVLARREHEPEAADEVLRRLDLRSAVS